MTPSCQNKSLHNSGRKTTAPGLVFLIFKLLFKISFQIFDLYTLLLHRVTVTYSYCAIFPRISKS